METAFLAGFVGLIGLWFFVAFMAGGSGDLFDYNEVPLDTERNKIKRVVYYPYLIVKLVISILVSVLAKPWELHEEVVFKRYFKVSPGWVNPDFYEQQKAVVDATLRKLANDYFKQERKFRDERGSYSLYEEAKGKFDRAWYSAQRFNFPVYEYGHYRKIGEQAA